MTQSISLEAQARAAPDTWSDERSEEPREIEQRPPAARKPKSRDVIEQLACTAGDVTPDMVAGIYQAATLAEHTGRPDLALLLRECAVHIEQAIEAHRAAKTRSARDCSELWLG